MSLERRYESLKLRESLHRVYDYPTVCNELSFILRCAYSDLPKNLQSVLFQDTLAAFRLLPQAQTQQRMRSANLLLQAAEAAFPKQKRVLAATEFKHAVVAYKRRHKSQEDEGTAQLPQDVLLYVFSFLDMRSLVASGVVCRSWNIAATDNKLWQAQYHLFFWSLKTCTETKRQIGEPAEKWVSVSHKKEESIDPIENMNWRDTFKRTYIGYPSKRFASNRAYCVHCQLVVWFTNMKCSNVHHGSKRGIQQINPVSPQQVVSFLLEDSLSAYSSDSDSDSDEGSTSKLWAYTRHCGI